MPAAPTRRKQGVLVAGEQSGSEDSPECFTSCAGSHSDNQPDLVEVEHMPGALRVKLREPDLLGVYVHRAASSRSSIDSWAVSSSAPCASIIFTLVPATLAVSNTVRPFASAFEMNVERSS